MTPHPNAARRRRAPITAWMSWLALLLGLWLPRVQAGPTEDFFFAVRNDQVSVVRDLLARGLDPNTRDASGQTGLGLAMKEQSRQVARVLLDRPAIDIDALNAAGESPLMLAALQGDLPDVQLLLARGAKVNQPGWSALHYAASGPEPKVVALLLDKGAEVDAASPNGSTPLMMAAQYGSEDSVRLLVSRGADPTRRNQRDLRAADFARLSGREGLTRKLEEAAARR